MVCGSSLAPRERALNPLLSSDPQGPLCEGEVSEHPDVPTLYSWLQTALPAFAGSPSAQRGLRSVSSGPGR